jgi:hypothetical protein
MNAAQSLIDSVGGLRDAVMSGFRWARAEGRLVLTFDDLTTGLAESADYQGPEPGEVVFREVFSVFMTVDPVQEGLMVYEARVVEEGEEFVVVEVKFRPGGTLTVNCGGIDLKVEG